MSLNYGQYAGGPQRYGSQYGRQQAPPARPTSGYGHQQPHPQQHQQQPYYPPAPPGSDPQLWSHFTSVDTDRSGSITVVELQRALINGNWTSFDLDTVKMLMSIFDTDRSGTINFTEFAGLWKYVSDWQNVFRHFDQDRSGSIEGHELAEAMRTFGYPLSKHLLIQLEHKYASEPSTGYGPSGGITFDRFVRACVAVKTLTEAFQRVDSDRDGWVQMNYEQFMGIVLSAP